jgi:hypothetical protein
MIKMARIRKCSKCGREIWGGVSEKCPVCFPKSKKEQLKGKLRAWVSAGSSSENYGFGSNWTLNIGKKNTPVKSFWLGQGAKVTSRMLGMDYGEYVKNVSNRLQKNKQFKNEKDFFLNKKANKIVTEDILHTALGDQYIDDGDEFGGGWSGEINSKRLKKLIKAQDWDLAVQ